ncbi:MAG TPA: DUF427 domain-containing protein [Candidatus Baltobacteraceae bacterium]|nr:DUF427 domain-containing protein [Candidatus Baltobacteraceae bacterium]
MTIPKLEPGQEWVWDYPRPPRIERSKRLVRIEFAGLEIARSARTWRVLETSHPPVFYIPCEDLAVDALRPAAGSSLCEWKGRATYYDLVVGDRVAERAAWAYLAPYPHYAQLSNSIAFYPARVDAAYVDDERVRGQPGDFYGGWITSEIIGPFKGARGTEGW